MQLLSRKKKKEKPLTEKSLKVKLKMYELADMKRQGNSVSYTIDALIKMWRNTDSKWKTKET